MANKFIHIQCRNTAKLDRVAKKIEDCKVIEISFVRFLKEAILKLFNKDGLKNLNEKAFSYIRNNYLKTKIRHPKFIRGPIAFILRSFLIFKCRVYIKILDEVFKSSNEEVALIWNGAYFPQTIIIDLAKKYSKKTLYFEVSPFSEKIQVDSQGVNYHSSLSDDPSFYLNQTFTNDETLPQKLSIRAAKIKKHSKPSDFPESYTFVPFQVPSDMQILDLSPWIKDMHHFYNEIVKLSEVTGAKFVIKEHPSYKLKIEGSVDKSKNVYFSSGDLTEDLIRNSNSVITINSSVGIESLVLEKKIISLGQANYNLDGLTLQAGNFESLLQAYRKLDSWAYDEKLRDAFLRYFYNRFLVEGTYENIDTALVERIKNKVPHG